MKKKCGQLFIVATPIGNLEDISQRAINILSSVNLIAAEDTRHSKKLLNHLQIKTPILSLHAHNEKDRINKLLSRLLAGENLALISDAGTPLISDPGQNLTYELRQAGIEIVPVPGPCALIAALSAAGLPANRFLFEGFLPVKSTSRIERLNALKDEEKTWVLYESPHRILTLVEEMLSIFGDDRYVVLARELTKLFETIKAGTLLEIKTWLLENSNHQKGEFVMVVKGALLEKESDLKKEHLAILSILLEELPLSQAVKLTSKITGENRNDLYAYAVEKVKK